MVPLSTYSAYQICLKNLQKVKVIKSLALEMWDFTEINDWYPKNVTTKILFIQLSIIKALAIDPFHHEVYNTANIEFQTCSHNLMLWEL